MFTAAGPGRLRRVLPCSGPAARCPAGAGRRNLASAACRTAPPLEWPIPGTTSRSKSLSALMSASTTRSVDSGGTFVSISPTISSSLPVSRFALSMFERRGVLRADRVAHPLLVPGGLVHAVVVAAARGHGGLVEVAVEEQRAHRILPAGRGAVDADARDVVVRVLRGDRLVPQDAVGKAGVLQVLPADVVERLRAVRRPHAVDLHDDEPEIGQRGVAVERAERLRHERALRPGVDALDHRILLVRVEVPRPAMMPQMSVLPSRPLAANTSGSTSRAFSSVMSASSSLHTSLPSSTRRSS